MVLPSLPLLSCESSVSVKENPDRKKQKKQKKKQRIPSRNQVYKTRIYIILSRVIVA